MLSAIYRRRRRRRVAALAVAVAALLAVAPSGSALAKPYQPGRGGTVTTRVSPAGYLHNKWGMVSPERAYLHAYGGMAATHLPPQPTPVATVGSPTGSVSTTSLVVAFASLCGIATVAGFITREVLARRRTLGVS